MHIPILSTLLLFITATHAVTMTHYHASKGVPAAFKTYLKGLYAAAEDPSATTAFTDYFPADGKLTVLTFNAVGAQEILALKHKLMPVEGYKRWNHFPGAVTVTSDEKSQAIYHVVGHIETTFDAAHANNCSSASYISEFTILKKHSTLDLTARIGMLNWYNDLEVTPSTSPTNIPCISRGGFAEATDREP